MSAAEPLHTYRRECCAICEFIVIGWEESSRNDEMQTRQAEDHDDYGDDD